MSLCIRTFFNSSRAIFPIDNFSKNSQPLRRFSRYPKEHKVYQKYKTVLTIAGSDPSGGAGMQADLKTFSTLGCYGMSVVTALTAQNTTGVQVIHSLPANFIGDQLRSVFDDIDITAIKIGMLERAEIINQVAISLRTYKKPQQTLVVDPVMFAKNGHQLITNDAIDILKEAILPLATIVTPNIYEACRLLGYSAITNKREMEEVAFAILNLGPEAVVIKGGALGNNVLGLIGKDCFVRKGDPQPYWLESKHIDTKNLHGTGCTFSAAITSYLAGGRDTLTAVKKAKHYIAEAIEEGANYEIGKGKGPVHHFYPIWPIPNFTQRAFLKIGPLYEQIKQLPFLKELASGELSSEKFAFYIIQDSIYLQGRAKALSILATKAPTQDLTRYLAGLSYSSQKGAETIFVKYGLPNPLENDLQQSPTCKLYIEEMLKTISEGSFNEGLVSLFPCTLIYQMIGESMTPNSNCPESYKQWINTYSCLERRKRVEVYIDLIDQIVAKSSYEEFKILQAVFYRMSELEYKFWDDAYHLRRGL